MTPTPKLRFLWRDVEMVKGQPPLRIGVFQQWWQVASTGQITTNGEWRDVPVEKEDK